MVLSKEDFNKAYILFKNKDNNTSNIGYGIIYNSDITMDNHILFCKFFHAIHSSRDWWTKVIKYEDYKILDTYNKLRIFYKDLKKLNIKPNFTYPYYGYERYYNMMEDTKWQNIKNIRKIVD